MPPPLTGGTNNQRSYSGPTTGSAFDSRTIPDSQGGGNFGVMSFQSMQDQQQAGWDQQVTVPNIAAGIATGALPGWNANGIEALPGPLLNPSNSWMTEFTPEAEQDLGYLLYGDLSGLGPPGDTGVLLAENGLSPGEILSILVGSLGLAFAGNALALRGAPWLSGKAGTVDLDIDISSGVGVAEYGLTVAIALAIYNSFTTANVDSNTGAFVDDTFGNYSGPTWLYLPPGGLPIATLPPSPGTCSAIFPARPGGGS